MASLEGNISDALSTLAKATVDNSSVALHSMASGEQVQKCFDFFGLPRELRDMVYKELLVDVPLDPETFLGYDDCFSLSVIRTTKCELSMVNRQFRDELQTLRRRHATILFEDLGGPCHSLRSGDIDYLFKRAPQLEFVIRIGRASPSSDSDVSYHFMWLSSLLDELNHLHHFNITAVICKEQCTLASEEQIVEELLLLTELKGLKVLQICHIEDCYVGTDPPHPHEAPIMKYRWTSQDRFLRELPGLKLFPTQTVHSDTSSISGTSASSEVDEDEDNDEEYDEDDCEDSDDEDNDNEENDNEENDNEENDNEENDNEENDNEENDNEENDNKDVDHEDEDVGDDADKDSGGNEENFGPTVDETTTRNTIT